MSQSIKLSAELNTFKILSGKSSVTTSAGDSATLVESISHELGKPILYKIYFTIDNSPIIYHSPILNTALSNMHIYVVAYIDNDTLFFEAYNEDTVSHTINLIYFIYADKFS